MNKKLATLFTELGMTVNKNSAYGIVNGYETSAAYNAMAYYNSPESRYPLNVHISCYTTSEQKRNIESAIRVMATKYFMMQFTQYGISLAFGGMTYGGIAKNAEAALKGIYNVLAENEVLKSEYCPVCGNLLDVENSKKCNIEGFTVTMDNACVETINQVINAENQDFNNAPNNYLKGFLGALIGGLAGVAVAVILYMVGFIASISAIISVVLGTFLYKKFHGKPNKMMLVIVSVTTIVLMAASVLLIYVIAAGIAANEVGMNTFELFSAAMANAEFARGFYADLAMVLVFSIIGIALVIVAEARKIKRRKNI